MNKFTTWILCLLINSTVICQNKNDEKFFFNEFYLNGNVSIPTDGIDFYGIGAGIGMARVTFKEKKSNLIFGPEINTFSTFLPKYSDNPKENYTNIRVSIYSFSIPIMYRLNFANSKRIFIQTGVSVDLNLFAFGQGDYLDYSPTNVTDPVNKTFSLNTENTITPAFSIGYKLIIRHRYIYIKADYLHSLNPVILGEMEGKFQGQYLRLNIGLSSK